MNLVFLCIGSNLGDRMAIVDECCKRIARECGVIAKTSSDYETAPWGSASRNKFINRVVSLNTALPVHKLHAKLRKIEAGLGGKKKKVKYGDRYCDIDILYYGKQVIDEKGLVIPHPRMTLRRFVLVPLNEIAPDHKHPFTGRTSARMLRECPDKLQVRLARERPLFICIEGNIGSGKSTLSKALARELKAQLLHEEFEHNPFLPLFYQDPRRYGFALEYSFLLDRLRQMNSILKKGPRILVSDYHLAKCVWFADVNLKSSDSKRFREEFIKLSEGMRTPDLVVYLDCSTRVLLKNIRKRGRKYELGIRATYLQKLESSYARGLKQQSSPVLHVSMPRHDRDSLKKALASIRKALGGI